MSEQVIPEQRLKELAAAHRMLSYDRVLEDAPTLEEISFLAQRVLAAEARAEAAEADRASVVVLTKWNNDLRTKLEAAERDAKQLREMLRVLEHCHENGQNSFCPECGHMRRFGADSHTPDCKLAALLQERL